MPPEETIYSREIEFFERTEELPHPVGVDILVNWLGCRQTEAEWSFDYLRKHSTPTTISGGSRRRPHEQQMERCSSSPNSIVGGKRISQMSSPQSRRSRRS